MSDLSAYTPKLRSILNDKNTSLEKNLSSSVLVTTDTTETLRRSPRRFKYIDASANKIADILKTNGIRRILKEYASGCYSVTAPFSGKPLVVKISNDALTANREIPELLQPILILHEHFPSMAVYPEVNTLDVTEKHVMALVISLKAKGMLFYDANVNNVGLLSDGTPIIIDSGSIIPFADRKKSRPQGSSTYEEKFTELTGIIPDEIPEMQAKQTNYSNAQTKHLKMNHIDATEIRNELINDNDLMHITKTFTQSADGEFHKSESLLSHAIEKLGLDGNLLQKLLENFAIQQNDNSGLLWRDYIADLIKKVEPKRAKF